MSLDGIESPCKVLHNDANLLTFSACFRVLVVCPVREVGLVLPALL